MSADSFHHHCCDECGRQMSKTHCVHKGRRYCSTCYPRIFKRQMCPKCGNFSRLPKDDSAAVCRKCENDKPCARCGKDGYTIGKITPYGPVCNACSPHFRKSEPCEMCGAPSARLTRASRLGHDRRVCPKCARADNGICQACTRHRQLQQAPDGRMLCRACLERGEIPCPKCRQSMPAGYGSQCRSCYWTGLLEKRIQMDCAAFSAPAMAMRFEAFGNWLLAQVGEHKAALTVHRYLPFFMEIERQWQDVPEYAALLVHFGAAKLRRVLLPMRWMEAAGLAMPDVAAKTNDSDRRRIVATLDKFALGSKERSLLDDYREALMENMKAGRMTLRSIRLALSPAAALLRLASVMEHMPLDQGVLDAYLAKTPGQRAAVSGFVRYLREARGAEIALPVADPGRVKQQRRKKLEADLVALMKEDGAGDEFKRRWISVTLAYFHGLSKKVGRMLQPEDVVQADEGVVVTLNKASYWLPRPPRWPL